MIMKPEETLLIFRVKNSRIKAKKACIMEVYAILKDLKGQFLVDGPLNQIRGIFSFMVPVHHLDSIHRRAGSLGYVSSIYRADFDRIDFRNHTDLEIKDRLIWKKQPFSLTVFYEADEASLRERAPDKRFFRILDHEGRVKDITGYRGDGSELGKRALPVEDARLLINLSFPQEGDTLLDPFAGAGGILYEAGDPIRLLKCWSADIDPILKPGLEMFGSRHITSDVTELSLPDEFFDCICTEVPFSEHAVDTILKGMENLYRMLKFTGRLVLMCSEQQSGSLVQQGEALHLNIYFNMPVNRKGTSVYVLAWSKAPCPEDAMFFERLAQVYGQPV